MGEPGSRTGEAKFGQCEWKSIHQNLAAIGQDFSSQSALEAYTILGGRA
jgi:hypothetical protein